MQGIMKIVKSLEESDLLMKGVGETYENEPKEKERKVIEMLLGSLGTSLPENE